MIEYIKGILFPGRRDIDNDQNYTSSLFSFRDKKFTVTNLEKKKCDPYLGCKLDKEAVVKLKEWLDECLLDPRCDKCWDSNIPFNFIGELKCRECGNIKIFD